jgi:hypothetical protein
LESPSGNNNSRRSYSASKYAALVATSSTRVTRAAVATAASTEAPLKLDDVSANERKRGSIALAASCMAVWAMARMRDSESGSSGMTWVVASMAT